MSAFLLFCERVRNVQDAHRDLEDAVQAKPRSKSRFHMFTAVADGTTGDSFLVEQEYRQSWKVFELRYV